MNLPENQRRIWCCACDAYIVARLTNGKEIYPRRPDLAHQAFWICDTCRNRVGCHKNTDKPTRPLGCIPTPELTKHRADLHLIIDPVWKSGFISRRQLYRLIAKRMGIREYHTAELRTKEDAVRVSRIVQEIVKELKNGC